MSSRRRSAVAFAVLALGSLGACANSCSKEEEPQQPSKPIEARPGADRFLNDKSRFRLYPPDAPAE